MLRTHLVARGAAVILPVAATIVTAAAAPPSGLTAFGFGAYGQLGSGGVASSAIPAAVLDAPAGVVGIAAGCFHSLAVTSAGTVYAWGLNQDGQLGDGSRATHTTPHRVAGLPANIVQIAAGCHYSLALTGNGEVWSWGESGQGELGDGTVAHSTRLTPVHVTALDHQGVVSVAAGGEHSAALTRDGTVYAWGDNRSGQLGSGDTTAVHALPTKLDGLPRVDSLALGSAHSLFVAGDGTLFAAGLNDHGQLGDGTTTDHATPVSVAHDIRQAAAGDDFSVAVTRDRGVLAWGRADSGQLATTSNADRTTPAAVAGLSDVRSVAAGSRHVLAVTGDALLGWGDGTDGELGNAGAELVRMPTPVSGVSDAGAVAAGDGHSLVLTSASGDLGINAAGGPEIAAIPNTSSAAPRTLLPALGAVLLASALVLGARRRRRRTDV